MNKNSIMIIIIVGLGTGLICSMVRNKTIKESTSEEKISIFKVCVELAKDNLELERKIKESEEA